MKHFFDFLGNAAMPAALFGIAWLFRRQLAAAIAAIPNLAGRVSKIGPLELQQQQAVVTAAIAEAHGDILEAHGEVGAPAAAAAALPPLPDIEPYEARIRELLQNVANREDHLVRELAVIARGMTGQQIFGTQLAVLRTLDTSGALPEVALNGLYQEHVRRATAAGFPPLSFLAWIGFLVDRRLVIMDNQGRYAITVMGRAFLQFANNTGLTEAKPF
jgi:hypothetical protein